MRKATKLVAVFVALAFVVGISAPLLTGTAQAQEKERLIESLKLQTYLIRAEHAEFHALLDKLAAKYPDDPELEALRTVWHDLMHKRMKAQEEGIDESMRMMGAAGGG